MGAENGSGNCRFSSGMKNVGIGSRLLMVDTGVSLAVWMVDGSLVETGGRLPILDTGVSVAV